MSKYVNDLGLREEIFVPKKGDVFIWHAYLYHGGTPIRNPSLTRKSLVSHYFVKSDCEKNAMPQGDDGYWLWKSEVQALWRQS